MHKFKKIELAAMFSIALAGHAFSQSEDQIAKIRTLLNPNPQMQVDWMGQMSNLLRPLMHGRDYFEASDLTLYKQVVGAQRRSAGMMRILSYDLEGNMEVTRAEIEEVLAFQMGNFGNRQAEQLQQNIKQQADKLMQFDKNGDGKLSGSELVAAAAAEPNFMQEDRTESLGQALLDVDSGKDGKITQSIIFTILARVAASPAATK